MASQSTQWILELIDKLSAPMGKINQSIDNATKNSSNLDNNLGKVALNAIAFQQVGQAVDQLNQHLSAAIAPGAQFDQTMAELSAITGFTGDALDDMGTKARKLAKDFGGSASAQAESFKIILSRLGPELARDSNAMELMGQNVAMLGKTMGGDSVAAVTALTTAMNQYGVDLSNPMEAAKSMSEMMDIMSKAAQVGSAEVPQVADALKVAGLVAKDANVSFEEMNAAIQVAGKASLFGSEAGTQLRNVFNKLGMGRFLPANIQEELAKAGVNINVLGDKSLSLQERLTELKKIEGDGALIQGLFGEGGANAAKALLTNIDLLGNYTSELQKATGATKEQADIIGGSFNEKMSRFKAQIEDVAIGFFNATKGVLPFIQGAMSTVTVLSQLASAASGVKLLYTGLTTAATSMGAALKTGAIWSMNMGRSLIFSGLNAIKAGASYVFLAVQGMAGYVASIITATAAQWGLNIAMNANPIGLIVLGIAAIGTAVFFLIKHWDTVKQWLIKMAIFLIKLNPFTWLFQLVDYLFPGIKEKIFGFFEGIWKHIVAWATKIWDKMKEIWGKIKSIFGFGGDEEATIKVDSSGEARVEGMEDLELKTEKPKDALNKNADTATPALTTAESKKETTVAGTGSGKQITMNLEIVNNFNIPENFESKIQEIKDKVTEAIVGGARDALVTLG